MSNICLYNASLRMDNSGNTAICQGNKYTLNQLILSISSNMGGKYTLNQPILSILAKWKQIHPKPTNLIDFSKHGGQILPKPTNLVNFSKHGEQILSKSTNLVDFIKHGGQILPKLTNLVDFGDYNGGQVVCGKAEFLGHTNKAHGQLFLDLDADQRLHRGHQRREIPAQVVYELGVAVHGKDLGGLVADLVWV